MKLKKTLRPTKAIATTAALLFGALGAHAWTAQELVDYCHGTDAFEITVASANVDYTPTSRPVQLSVDYIDGIEMLKVSNFLGAFNIYFIVNGNTVTAYKVEEHYAFPTVSGESTPLPGNENVSASQVVLTPVNVAYNVSTDENVVQWVYDKPYEEPDGSIYYIYTSSEYMNEVRDKTVYDIHTEGLDNCVHKTDWSTTIETDMYGNVQFYFSYYSHYASSGGSVRLDYQDAAGNTVASDVMSQYLLTLFQSNGTVTDSKHDEPYNIKVEAASTEDGKTEFTITNFANMGYLCETTTTPWPLVDRFTGYIEGSNVIVKSQGAYTTTEGSRIDEGHPAPLSHNFYFMGFNDDGTQVQDEITGRFRTKEVHHTGEGHWVYTVPGGKVHTIETGIVELDTYGMYERATIIDGLSNKEEHELGYNGTPAADATYDTEINFDFNQDVTFDCALTDFQYTFKPSYTYKNPYNGQDYAYIEVSMKLTEVQNPQYTTHYEIYVVEGAYKTAGEFDFMEPKSNLIGTVYPDKVSGTGTYDVNGIIYVDGTVQEVLNGDFNDYSFYVIAYYDTENPDVDTSKLTPTYHVLTEYTFPDNISGVSDAVISEKPVVTGGTGHISIENYQGDVIVYDVFGNEVYSGCDRLVDMAGGIYLVRTGSVVSKVVVR